MAEFHIIMLDLKNPPVFEVVASDVCGKLGTESGKNTLILNYLRIVGFLFCFVNCFPMQDRKENGLSGWQASLIKWLSLLPTWQVSHIPPHSDYHICKEGSELTKETDCQLTALKCSKTDFPSWLSRQKRKGEDENPCHVLNWMICQETKD